MQTNRNKRHTNQILYRHLLGHFGEGKVPLFCVQQGVQSDLGSFWQQHSNVSAEVIIFYAFVLNSAFNYGVDK